MNPTQSTPAHNDGAVDASGSESAGQLTLPRRSGGPRATSSGTTRGRPRDKRVDDAVRRAVFDLLSDVGYDAMTMEAIAARAGVGKPALYRRWSSKAELVFSQAMHDADHIAPPDAGSLTGDFEVVLTDLVTRLSVPTVRVALPAFFGHLGSDRVLAAKFDETFIPTQQRVIAQILDRAIQRGEISVASDAERVHMLLVGPVLLTVLYYRRDLRPDEVRRLAADVAGVIGFTPLPEHSSQP